MAVLSVAEHCARGTSKAGDAVAAVGYALNVERTVTRVVIDTSLSKLNSILSGNKDEEVTRTTYRRTAHSARRRESEEGEGPQRHERGEKPV